MSDVIVKVERSEPLAAFVQEQTEKGNFESPAAYIQNLVEEKRLNSSYEEEIDAKILEAIQSDRPDHVVTPAFWEERRAGLKARLEEARQNR